jgi:hypothetical protein
VAQQLEGLKLSQDQAEAIVEKGIEYGAYSDEMPDSKKEILAAADEIVAFSVDAYVNDEIRSDDEDPQVAESGAQIEEILEMAGVEIDEDGTVTFGEAPEAEKPKRGRGKKEDKSDDEAPFDPDDYIEGYTELSVVTKLKKVKELNADDDDDAAILEALMNWENEQEKPSSRILAYIEETLDVEPGGGDEGDNGGDGEATEEPWEGYDKASAVDIKKILTEARDDEDDPLTLDQVQYVLDYETAREKPPTRKRVVDFCTALIEEMGEDKKEDKPTRGRGRGAAKKTEPKASDNGAGVLVLTREQILTALDSGEVTVEFGE